MEKLTIEQIEGITFQVISMEGSYKLKRVEVNHPMQNVANLIKINENYYQKEYLPVIPIQTRPRKSFLERFTEAYRTFPSPILNPFPQ